MREDVEVGAHQPLGIFHVEDVRGDANAGLVRLVDDGGILFRGDLLDLAVPVVDPDLDDLNVERGIVPDSLAALLLGLDLERRTHRLFAGDAASGAEEARGAGDHLVAHRHKFEIVRAHAHGGADAAVAALLQVADQLLAVRAQMHVRVDDRRHHGLAGEVHARGAGGHRDALPGLDDLVAVDDERAVLDDAAVAEDKSCAFERRDVGAHRTGNKPMATAAVAATAFTRRMKASLQG